MKNKILKFIMTIDSYIFIMCLFLLMIDNNNIITFIICIISMDILISFFEINKKHFKKYVDNLK